MWAHAGTGGNAHALPVERGDDAIEVGDFKGDVAARGTGVFLGEDQVDFDVATAIPGTSKVVIWPGNGLQPQDLFVKCRCALEVTCNQCDVADAGDAQASRVRAIGHRINSPSVRFSFFAYEKDV